jgi:hypothetical protein
LVRVKIKGNLRGCPVRNLYRRTESSTSER